MQISLFKTPLYAAFFCAFVLSSCSTTEEQTGGQCQARNTPISAIQGSDYTSSMLGQQVTVRGVVSLIQDGKGLYLEETDADSNPHSSNAIFIQTARPPKDITIGSLVTVRGNVDELGERRDTLTALTGITDLDLCARDQPIPLTEITLPLNSNERESIEGMRIHINAPLVATDVYQFGSGNITLSGNGLQYIPTEIVAPGDEAIAMQAENRSFAVPVKLPENMPFPELVVSGMTVDQITGVVTHDDRGKRVVLQSISSFDNRTFEPPAAASDGSLRVVGMNLHNYFNGDGKGAGFPTPRGAKTLEGFENQRGRIGAAIKSLDPHVVAVMELENDGFGIHSAAQDLIDLAEEATGYPWQATRPVDDNTGPDHIAVGIFYRTDQLKAIGPARTLTGPEFERSRQPQAQLFKRSGDGEKIVIVINHLKSKGSCPDSGENANQKDGQGCWNPMRRVSAEKMSAWAKEIAFSAGTENILILGDMNAYRNEDPITAIRKAGFTELMDPGLPQKGLSQPYSFVYYGQHGTLDYAFSSPQLRHRVDNTFIWNVNAAMPARVPLPQPWLGFSDHDPVVIDIR